MVKNDTGSIMPTRTMGGPVEATLSLQRCSLVEVQGPNPGKVFALESGRTVVGKSPDCDVLVPDVTVSRQHFEVQTEGQRYLVRDLDSTNGTVLDGAEGTGYTSFAVGDAQYDGVVQESTAFSPDSERLAYLAQAPMKKMVSVGR